MSHPINFGDRYSSIKSIWYILSSNLCLDRYEKLNTTKKPNVTILFITHQTEFSHQTSHSSPPKADLQPLLCLFQPSSVLQLSWCQSLYPLFFSLTPRWAHTSNAPSYPNIHLMLHEISKNRTIFYCHQKVSLIELHCSWSLPYRNSRFSKFLQLRSQIKV